MENDFKPLDFKSENDLSTEIDILLDNISDVQKDWKLRENTIKKIGGVIGGKWGKNSKFLKTFNSKIITNLSIQMLDLRSTVMREACNVVAFAAKQLGILFEQSALYVVSSGVLFKLIASANKVISEGGSNCLEEVIRSVHSSKLMMKVLEQSGNKNTCARLRAAQNFLYMISNYDKTMIEKNIPSIEEFIHAIAHDASPEVRNSAKSIFLKYMQIYPNKAEALLIRLDNNIQKVIRELIRNSGKVNETVTQNVNPFSMAEPKKINTIEENYKTHSSILRSPTKFNDERKKSNIKEYEREKVENTLLTNNNNYNNISNNTTDNSSSIKNSKSKSSISNKSVNSSPKIVRTPQRENENRNSVKRPSIVKSNNNDKSLNINTEMYRAQTAEDKIPLPNQTVYKLDAEIKEFLIKANSSYLSIKIAAIEKIINLLKSNNFDFTKISNIVLEKLIDSFTNLIKENNNCGRFTMDIVSMIIDKDPSILNEFHISKMIQPIIENIASNTSEISQSASNLLINFKKTYNPNYITKPVITLLEKDFPDEKHIVCLEVISITFNLMDETLKDTDVFNNFILNLATLLFQKKDNKEILFRIVDIIEKVYKNYSYSLSNCFNKYIEDYDIKKNLVKILEYYKKEISDFIITNNNENNKQNKNIYTNSNMKMKDSEKKENRLYTENYENEKINANYANRSTPVSNQKSDKNPNEIKRFPEDYNYSKQSNSSILIKSYKLDNKGFADILAMNESNVEEFLHSLNKVQQNELNHVLEHISYVLRNKTFLFKNNLDLLINRLVTLYENYPDNYELINQNFNLISIGIEPNIFLNLVSRYICQSSPAIIQIILNTLNISFNKCNKDHLLFLLPRFIDSLFMCINHKITEIRKLAVFCIVELYVIIGTEFDMYLNQLNTAQRNLISIYINKRTKKF